MFTFNKFDGWAWIRWLYKRLHLVWKYNPIYFIDVTHCQKQKIILGWDNCYDITSRRKYCKVRHDLTWISKIKHGECQAIYHFVIRNKKKVATNAVLCRTKNLRLLSEDIVIEQNNIELYSLNGLTWYNQSFRK